MITNYKLLIGFGTVALAFFIILVSSTSAYALIDLSPKTSINYGVNTSVDTNTKEDSKAEENTEVVNVERSTLKGDNRSEVGEEHRAVIIGPGDVRTFGDLRSFAEAKISADEDLDELNFTNRAVEVRYKQHGRFLALVPITLKVKITVNADGTVKVKYPWYSVLTIDNQDQIEAKVKVAVDNALKGRMVGSVQADGKAEMPTLTASELATLVESMQAVLKASFD